MPKTDEFWIARIKSWPGSAEIVTVVKIYYAWHDGAIQFVPLVVMMAIPFGQQTVKCLSCLSELKWRNTNETK